MGLPLDYLPNVAGSRLTTITVAALTERGYSIDDIVKLYRDQDREGLEEAVDVERSLGNLAAVA